MADSSRLFDSSDDDAGNRNDDGENGVDDEARAELRDARSEYNRRVADILARSRQRSKSLGSGEQGAAASNSAEAAAATEPLQAVSTASSASKAADDVSDASSDSDDVPIGTWLAAAPSHSGASSSGVAPTDSDAALLALKKELRIPDPIAYVRAARDALADPACRDLKAHAIANGLRHQTSVWKNLVKIVGRLGWHSPPAVAIDTARTEDATLLNNLQLFLRVATMGGCASRGATALSTLAVAVESMRDPHLNLLAACARHGYKAFTNGPGLTTGATERIDGLKSELGKLGLLNPSGAVSKPEYFAAPIAQADVASLQEEVKVCVAVAARALVEHGSVDAAIAHLRSERGEAAPDAADNGASDAPLSSDDPILVPLAHRLKNGNAAPALDTTAAALAMCRDESLSIDAACARAGFDLSVNRKLSTERVLAVRDRLQALGPLETLLASLADEAEARALPLTDAAWLAAVQERIGPMRQTFGSFVVAPAELPYLCAALEFARDGIPGVAYIKLLCARHGVSLATCEGSKLAHIRELRDRVQETCVAEVARSEVTDPKTPPSYDEAMVASLRLRLSNGDRFTHQPAAENVVLALDLHHESDLNPQTAGFRRRADLGRSTGASRRGAIEDLRSKLAGLTPPLDAIVDESTVRRVHELAQRSGLGPPPIATVAEAVRRHGSDTFAACNQVRLDCGKEAVDEAAIASDDDMEEATVDALVPSVQPPPISDELVAELKRRTCARLKRSEHHLPADKFFRAAADLCRDDTRSVNWNKLDIVRVCGWHGIALDGHGTKSKLERLRELRTLFKDYGCLETLLTRKGLDDATLADTILFNNVQLLLQTATAAGIFASRSPHPLGMIAVAVYLHRDPSLDVDESLDGHGCAVTGGAERARETLARIRELDLLNLDHSKPIDRSQVERVRSLVQVNIADAARAVLTHGADLSACAADLRARLGLSIAAGHVEVVSESQGLQLHLSRKAASGYKGVQRSRRSRGEFFEAWGARDGVSVSLGLFPSAVEAAVAYARHLEAGGDEGDDDDDDDDDEEDDDDDDDDDVEDAEEGEASPGVPPRPGMPLRVPVKIIRDNNAPDRHKRKRWLVQWEGYEDEEDATWEPREKLPASLIAAYEHQKQVAFNWSLEPLLCEAGGEHSSGVLPVGVSAEAAGACAAFLRDHWRDGKLVLPGLAGGDEGATAGAASKPETIMGWTTYGKTLSAHDAEQQRQNTLLMTNVLLPACRAQLPGFAAIEAELVDWLHARSDTVVELFYAHSLRQGPHTLQSTGFDVHQDTEDYDFIEYTVVVKLTPDRPDELPSQMRVVGAAEHFCYGAAAGDSGCFKARLYHASVEPASEDEHLKIAFFFRKSTMGERRAKRALESESGAELVQRRKAIATQLGQSALGATPAVQA